jgi:hypothetical protein
LARRDSSADVTEADAAEELAKTLLGCVGGGASTLVDSLLERLGGKATYSAGMVL